MLNNISWHSYWTFTGFSVAIYYLFILGYYFIGNRELLTQGKRKWLPVKHPNSSEEQYSAGQEFPTQAETLYKKDDSTPVDKQFGDNDLHLMTKALLDEVEAFLNAASSAKFSKDQIVSSLKLLLNKYPALKHSEYRSSIIDVITTSFENTCSMHLSVDEVSEVWNS